MADLLKITTPVVNKSQVQQGKQPPDASAAFDLREINKVVKPQPQSEMQGNSNGMVEKEEAPAVLVDMLKDPSVTVNFLKNITLLQEIIRLLPVNNKAVTQDIEQLFSDLMIGPEEIVGEMQRQENSSTVFKGELFDFLRNLVRERPSAELKFAVANLLKAINCEGCRQDVLDALSNCLTYLSDALDSSRTLSDKLALLAERFAQRDSAQMFPALKQETFELLREVEDSILFSPKMSKVVSMIYYNLSRFNDNPDFFQEALSSLMLLLNGKQQKSEFMESLRQFIEGRGQQENARPEDLLAQQRENQSRVMDVLAKIIGRESDKGEAVNLLNAEKVERIIHSLLSSPCNFTPLLHYVIPVEYMDMKSFAEVWINPNGTEDDRPIGLHQSAIHMLVVFDIEGIGQFEAELIADESEKRIDLSLRCPPQYVDAFASIPQRLSRLSQALSYKFGDISLDKLDKTRSLMDVFKSLPYKRTGVNVRV